MQEYSTNNIDIKNFALELFRKLKPTYRPVFMCVGSDKFICDSLAPIISEMLTTKYNINAYVYGGLNYNINAHNLMEAYNYIETEHPYSQIILIDATLGNNIGNVIISEGGFGAFGRELPIKKIGNFSILGVVGHKHKDFNLNSTKLKIVLNMANFISKGIAMALSVKGQYCNE